MTHGASRGYFGVPTPWRKAEGHTCRVAIARHDGTLRGQMPVDTLLSNWAHMVMTALAWTLKAWFALRLPETGRWAAQYAAEKAAVLRMEFKAFLHAFMLIPVQVVRTSRRIVFRLLAWNPWQAVFLRGFDHLRAPLRA